MVLLISPAAFAAGRKERKANPEERAAPAEGSPAEGSPAGTVHALLINGGSNPEVNFQSHLHHLEDMVDILAQRGLSPERIHIFSADGEAEEADLAVRDLRPDNFWLISGLPIGRRLRPETELTDTRWDGIELQAARVDALREWFEGAQERFTPADRLLLFVTDHGTENLQDPDNGFISMWQEQMSVEQLKEMLAFLPPGMRTVMVMSQCYSGSFANAMFDIADAEPSGEVCGFFSVPKDLQAYGCYAEGRDRDRIGHAFRFIQALDRQSTTSSAHTEVLVTDTTPDVPIRTSDTYLESILAHEAAARDESIGAFTDSLLEVAWGDRGAWESDIRLLDRLGDAYGAFSPRSLSEIETYSDALPALVEQMKTYADRWRLAAVGVKREILTAFRCHGAQGASRRSADGAGSFRTRAKDGMDATELIACPASTGPRRRLAADGPPGGAAPHARQPDRHRRAYAARTAGERFQRRS
jgi:hypothetical protein